MPRMARVAVAQMAPVFMDRARTVAKICDWVARAGREGARVVVFPEAIVPGYPYWTRCIDVQSSAARNRLLYEQALVMESDDVQRIAHAARAAGTAVVFGATELGGRTLYCSQVFISAEGRLLGVRRKLMPTQHERMVWGMGDGRDLQVHTLPEGRIGGLICFEHSNPLYCYGVLGQGEDFHAALWPGGMWTINGIVDAAIRHYAFQAQCFVLCATSLMTPEILEALGDEGSVREFLRPGNGASAIVSPRGSYLAPPRPDEEALLVADANLDDIIDLKITVDSAGHYARPDVLSLHVRRGAQRPLVFDSGPAVWPPPPDSHDPHHGPA